MIWIEEQYSGVKNNQEKNFVILIKFVILRKVFFTSFVFAEEGKGKKDLLVRLLTKR